MELCQWLELQTPKKTGKFFSAYDLNDYTKGSGELTRLAHSQTIQTINETHAKARKQFKKLNYHGEPTTQIQNVNH